MNGGENASDGNKTASAPAVLFFLHNAQKLHKHVHSSVASLISIALFKNLLSCLQRQHFKTVSKDRHLYECISKGN